MDRRQAGLKAFGEMYSPEMAKQMEKAADSDIFGAHMVEMTVDHVYGEIWSRPGLDRRARSLFTLGILIALGAYEELDYHLVIARNNGLTATEVEELLYHATAYAGFPAVGAARKAAAKVFGKP